MLIKKFRNKRIISIMILFLFLIPLFMSFNVLSISVVSYDNITISNKHHSTRNSEGNLYVIFEDSNNDIQVNKSIDNGITWLNIVTIIGTYKSPRFVIDSGDYIHICYAGDTIGADEDFYYRYITPFDVLSSVEKILDVTEATSSVIDLDITIDNANNIYYSQLYLSGVNYVLTYFKYDNQLQTWGSQITVKSDNQGTTDGQIRSFGNDIVVGYTINTGGGMYQPFIAYKRGDDSAFTHYQIDTITDVSDSQINIEFDASGRLHIVYSAVKSFCNAKRGIFYTTYYYGIGLEDIEIVYYDRTNSFNLPCLSINQGGNINIIFYGKTNATANNKILFKTYDGNSFSSLAYLSIGGDSHTNSNVIYQHYPYSCILVGNGLAYFFDNITSNTLMFGTENNIVWYSEDYGGGGEFFPCDTSDSVRMGNLQSSTNYYNMPVIISDSWETNTGYPWWDFLKIFPEETTEYTSYYYVEWDYNQVVDMKITNFAVKMNKIMRTYWGLVPSDLLLHINGYFAGVSQGYYTSSSDYDIYYWCDLDIDIENQKLNFEMTSLNTPIRFFLPCKDNPPEDIDGDNDVEFKFHGDINWRDGQYNGDPVGLEFPYAFWYESEIYAPKVYSNEISIKEVTSNTCSNFEINYKCDARLSVNVAIESGITEYYNESTILTGLDSGNIIYSPIIYGTYTALLYDVVNNIVLDYDTIIITNGSCKYNIRTSKNPSLVYESITISYLYNETTADGYLKVFDSNNNLYNNYDFYIEKNTAIYTDINNIYFNQEGIYKIQLYLYKNNQLYPVGSPYYQIVKQIRDNDIYLKAIFSNGQSIDYRNNDTSFNLDGLDLYFVGHHNFVGSNIYISVSGQIISVSDSAYFNEKIPSLSIGQHIAYLKVEGFTDSLDSIRFTISNIVITPKVNPFDLSTQPVYVKVLIALTIIIGLTMTPLALASWLTKAGVPVKIPSLLYVAFFFMGMISSIILGVLDTWTIFIVLFGLIITFAILWIQKKGEPE